MKATLVVILTLFLFFTVVHAQETNSKAQTAGAVQRQKAFELLESLATQLTTLQSAENRARIGANIADSLWTHDEKRARALFISIEDDINWGLRVRENITARDDYATVVFMQLRTDTVARIAKRDAELALDFLRATAPTYDNPPPAVVERERAFEVELATQIVASNPDLALKLGRQSLSRRFSDDLLPLLKQLHKKRREHGVTLYKETVRKLRDADLVSDRRIVNFVRSLAEYVTPPLADEPAFRELITFLVSEALNNRCGKPNEVDDAGYFCSQVRSLVPQMQKSDPLQAAQLKHLAPDNNAWSHEMIGSPYAELQQALDTGDLDEAVALTRKYPDMAGTIIWQVVMKAQSDGDIESARKIANEFDGDPEVRRRLLADLDEREGSSALTDEQLAEAQTEINQMTRTEDRINLTVLLANRIAAKRRPAALKLLDQATEILETQKPGKYRTGGQLVLALMYCAEKSDRGLAMMESLLPKLNELIDAGAKLDSFDTHYMRDGEWNMSADGALGEILTYLAQNAKYFAWCDFDRAVSLAAQFERNEIRIMAQLKLAQGILAGPPKHFQLSRGVVY